MPFEKKDDEVENEDTVDFDITGDLGDIEELDVDTSDITDEDISETVSLEDEIRAIVKEELEAYFADEPVVEYDENGDEIVLDPIVTGEDGDAVKDEVKDEDEKDLIDEGFIKDLMWKLSKYDKPENKNERPNRNPNPSPRKSREDVTSTDNEVVDTSKDTSKETSNDDLDDVVELMNNKYGRTASEEDIRDKRIRMSKQAR